MKWRLALAFTAVSITAVAQTPSLNPDPGDVWSYQGPTFGSGWVNPNNLDIMARDASNASLPSARLNLFPNPVNGNCLVGNGSDWVSTPGCGGGGGGGMDTSASNAIQTDALRNITNQLFTVDSSIIKGGSGTVTPVYGDKPSTVMAVGVGTAASPTTAPGPPVSIDYHSNVALADCTNNPANTPCTSALRINSRSYNTSSMTINGITAYASAFSPTGSGDAQGINALGTAIGGFGQGLGVFALGTRAVNTARAVGAEIGPDNRTSTDCPVTLNNSENCIGIWIPSRAAGVVGRKNSSAIHIGSADGSVWTNAFTINPGTVTGTTLQDASSTDTSLAIQGTHTTALSVGTTGGAVSLANTTLPSPAAGILGIAGNYPSTPTFGANGESAIFGQTSGGLSLMGQGSTYDYRVLNKNADPVLRIPTGTQALDIPGNISISGTTLPTVSVGILGLGGIQSGAPGMTVNGEGDIYLLSASGLNLEGMGSNFDVMLRNRAGSAVLDIPTGTTNVNVVGTLTPGTLTTDTIKATTPAGTAYTLHNDGTNTSLNAPTGSNSIKVAGTQIFHCTGSGCQTDVGTITNIPTPSAGSDAVNKTYADSIASGIVTHAAVQVATTANLNATASGTGAGKTLTNAAALAAFSVDGVSPSVNDRILVKDQTTQKDNGIYTLTTVGSGAVAWVLTRATDFDQASASEVAAGAAVIVIQGTANARTQWVETGQGPFTVDTTAIIFSGVTAASNGTVNAGTANQLGYYAGAGTAISGLTTANNGVLITSAGGVPSIGSTLPSAVQGNITSTGTIGTGVWQGTVIGTTYGGCGASLAATGGAGKVLKQASVGANCTVAQVDYSELTGVLPNPSAATLGGIESIAAVANNWIDSISTLGVPHLSQPTCASLSGAGSGCSTTVGTAATEATGTSGHTLPFLDGANDWSAATQTFGSVMTAVNAQVGTTYTLLATDCGWTVKITNASPITVTAPNNLAVGCHIAVVQGGAGQITVSPAAGANLRSAHSYTKTFGQSAGIGLSVLTNSGGSSAEYYLFGDGA